MALHSINPTRPTLPYKAMQDLLLPAAGRDLDQS
jgi:hypothetical protein